MYPINVGVLRYHFAVLHLLIACMLRKEEKASMVVLLLNKT